MVCALETKLYYLLTEWKSVRPGMFFRDKNSPILDRMKVGLAYYGGMGGKVLRDKNTQFLD